MDPSVPARVRLDAAKFVVIQAMKANDTEFVEERLTTLEQAAEKSKLGQTNQ